MLIVLFLLLAGLSCCGLTYWIYHYSLTRKLLDIPNNRSSHSIPTPRGGGVSVVVVFLITLLSLHYFNFILLEYTLRITLVLSSLLIAGVGFWDDFHAISARWRFSIHLLAILLITLSLPQLPVLVLFNLSLNVPIFTTIFYTLALAWLLNLYNFMDGIDGLASIEAISVCLGAVLLLLIQGEFNWSLIIGLLASCLSGFLIWNWPHAKIFMGDACSGFLGFILGFFALLTALEGWINLWSWMILLAFFIADATVTLLDRFLKGEQWYQAHCTHAYQYQAQRFIQKFKQQGTSQNLARIQSHIQINITVLVINILWLLPLAFLANTFIFWGFSITLLAYLPLIFFVKHIRHNKCLVD
ncbi:MAG: glycosyltransferase family 4 protein [Methylococcales bacterium]|nr:glycosyltransferase family 4 protein [Methylococcales bacterium]